MSQKEYGNRDFRDRPPKKEPYHKNQGGNYNRQRDSFQYKPKKQEYDEEGKTYDDNRHRESKPYHGNKRYSGN